MADPKQTTIPAAKVQLPKRCGEKVKRARIHPEAAIMPLPPHSVLEAHKDPIGEMALHPWGLAVICRNEVVVISGESVTSVSLAEEPAAQPPVDNEHVELGAEQFSPEVVAANAGKRGKGR